MYEVIRPIAAGHQGIVHLARDPQGRLVAMKRLAVDGDPAERAVARRRLRREAELLKGLAVPGVVPLLDVLEEHSGDTGGPDVVLVMPYLRGGSLHDRVATGGPIPVERLGDVAVPLIRAVVGLHRHGVLHRDIKPSNVLFDTETGGRPHLIDLGIGTGRDITAGLTAGSHLLGTPAFIAPERARGETATAASDIYSLGATLRFALTGMPPHGVGDVVTMVGRAAAGRVEPLPETIPAHVVEVLDRMCAPDPADRPTAAELLPGPDGTLLAPSASATTSTGRPAARRVGSRRTALAAVGAVGLVALGLVAGLATAGWFDDDVEQAGAEASLSELLATTTTTAAATTTTTCEPVPYQDCDDPAPAPGTDGTDCLPGRVDHDGEPANGCEAEPDDVDETEVRSGSIEGTIIPVGDVDKVLLPVSDRWQLLCDARLTLSLTAPDGLDLEMRAFDDGREITALSVPGGTTERARIGEPSCARNDSSTLEVVIRAVDGRSAEPWILERSGSW